MKTDEQIYVECTALARDMGDRLALSDNERSILNHWMRWGSDGYPVHKLGRQWTWGPTLGGITTPAVFNTRREAVVSWEAYVDTLIDRAGADAGRRAEREGNK